MGTEDMRRQRPNVERMGLLGATVEPVEAGARTLKEAVSAAIRDWVTNVATTHYIIGSAVGPAPYPALVRDLQRVIGDEARAQMLETRGPPAGPRRRLRGRRQQRDRHVRRLSWWTSRSSWSASRRPGRGSTGATARRSPPGARACCTARCRRSSRTRTGRSSRHIRSPPGLDYPGVGPEHAHLRDTGRVRYVSVTDDEAVAAFKELSRLEGIIPALEPAHAIAWVLDNPAPGRGDHARDAQRPRRQGPGRGPFARWLKHGVASGSERIAAAFRGRRAALMPYLMGGFPSLARVARGGAGLRRVRRPRRARRAVLRSARRRARDPGRGPARAARRARRSSGCSTRSPAPLAQERPGGADVLREPAARARASERGRRRIAERGVSGLIVPDMPAAEAGELRARVRRGRHRAGPAGRAHDASRRGAADRRVGARIRLRGLGDRRHRRARGAAARARRGGGAGARGGRASRSRSDSGSGRRSRSPRWARSRTA